MTDPLADALYSIGWGAERTEQSTPLTSEECRALGEYIEELKARPSLDLAPVPAQSGERVEEGG